MLRATDLVQVLMKVSREGFTRHIEGYDSGYLHRSFMIAILLDGYVGTYQVHSATLIKLDEIFRVCIAFFSNHFSTKYFLILMLPSVTFP